MSSINHILRVDASARETGSISRQLGDKTIQHLSEAGPVHITERNVSRGLPFVNEGWVTATFTPPDQRGADHTSALAGSDELVDEVEAADTIVITTPIYNFGLPASLKAWIDMICRVGRTFKYTETGPVGLLKDKRVIVLVASGGTPVGSEIDFATPYLKHILGFIGLTNVTIIAADALGASPEKVEAAQSQILALAA